MQPSVRVNANKVAAIMEHKLSKKPSVYLYLAQLLTEKPQFMRVTSSIHGLATQ